MLILGRWAGQGPLVAKASPELARTAARSCRELPVTHRGGGWPLSHCQNPWSHQGSTEVEGLGRGSQPCLGPRDRSLSRSRGERTALSPGPHAPRR